MVNTIYAHEVEYMICMREKENDEDPNEYFKIYTTCQSVRVRMRTLMNFKMKGLYVTQFGVNDNIATTCHKLQGVSLDSLIVHSFNYGLLNWVYVVLSKVKTKFNCKSYC